MSILRPAILLSVVLLAACGTKRSSPPASTSASTSADASPAAQQPQDSAPPPALPPVAAEQPPLQQGEARVQQPPPAPSNPSDPAPAREPQPVEARRQAVTLPAGTRLPVRLEQTLNTKRNRAGDPFVATLDAPVTVGRDVVLPRGTQCEGHLVESKSSGRLKGRAVMSLSLDRFRLNGRAYRVATSRFSEASGRHRKRNLAFIGGGGGFGAAVGAIAGGPAGALIGAGAGAAAGTTGAVLTGKKNVRLPVETRLIFVLQAPVELR